MPITVLHLCNVLYRTCDLLDNLGKILPPSNLNDALWDILYKIVLKVVDPVFGTLL